MGPQLDVSLSDPADRAYRALAELLEDAAQRMRTLAPSAGGAERSAVEDAA